MSIEAHITRLSPQLALELAQVNGDVPATPSALDRPLHDMLVDAAERNECVRSFIARRLPTWSDDRVSRNPPCYLVYEHGEVVGSIEDLPSMIRHAQKRRGMGKLLGIRALRPDDDVLPYNIGVRWGPTHPRRFRYEQRMALKRLLARGDRGAVGSAMRLTQIRFLTWAAAHKGLASRVLLATGLSLKEFWRTVRGRTQ